MKRWKQLDIVMQILLISLSVAYGTYAIYRGNACRFIDGYFVVGSWQLISALVHRAKKINQFKGSARTNYQKILLLLLLVTMASLAGFIIQFLFFALFATPLIAIWYLLICMKEFKYSVI